MASRNRMQPDNWSDTIEAERLLAESPIRFVEWVEELDSTNNRALQLANDASTVTPFLIGAERQTAGRGRGANRWWGAEGSLMFSAGVDLAEVGLSMSQWPRFSLVTGLAIADSISAFLPSARVGVKWPNDVWIDARKVCGILIEQATQAPSRLIVGIGINVNNSFLLAPEDQQQIAVSMSDAVGGETFSRTDLLIEFLSRWDRYADDLATDELNLAERWSRSCVLTGRAITITNGTEEKTGICAGIDDDGSLLLRGAFTMERCYAGTVRLLN